MSEEQMLAKRNVYTACSFLVRWIFCPSFAPHGVTAIYLHDAFSAF